MMVGLVVAIHGRLAAGELRQRIEHQASKHVIARDGLVLEDAVVKQVDRAVLMYAE